MSPHHVQCPQGTPVLLSCLPPPSPGCVPCAVPSSSIQGPLYCHILLGGSSFPQCGVGQEGSAPQEGTVGQQELWHLQDHPSLAVASQEDSDTQFGDPGVPEKGPWGGKLCEITPVPKSGVGRTWGWVKDGGQEGPRDGLVTQGPPEPPTPLVPPSHPAAFLDPGPRGWGRTATTEHRGTTARMLQALQPSTTLFLISSSIQNYTPSTVQRDGAVGERRKEGRQ